MRKFVRQKASGKASGNAPDVEIDFGAAAAKVARVFEPGEYSLRIQAASVVQRNENTLVVLDLVEIESGCRIDNRPLWVDGPRSDRGNLTADHQHLIGQLLTLAKLPTVGYVGELIPKLAGLEFNALLVLDVDNRSSRSFNAIANVYVEDAS